MFCRRGLLYPLAVAVFSIYVFWVISSRLESAGVVALSSKLTSGRGGGNPLTITSVSPQPRRQQPSSVGKLIQEANSQQDLIHIAENHIWNVGDHGLPPHYCYQAIHHERRQRWNAQWLTAWLSFLQYDDATLPPMKCLERVVGGVAVATPHSLHQETHEGDRADHEGRWLGEALNTLHGIIGLVYHQKGNSRYSRQVELSDVSLDGIGLMVDRINHLAPQLDLGTAMSVRWAIQGLMARCSGLERKMLHKEQLDAATSHLPFDILPLQVDWHDVASDGRHSDAPTVSVLRQLLPFRRETITTRSGSVVTERRATAWCTTCPTIGALAYSGKLMAPQTLPDALVPILTTVAHAVKRESGFFDAVLCNDYPDTTAACAFHTDPDHGTVWDRTTCVVAAGTSRRFAFRPRQNKWTAVTELWPGDVVHMWGECNDDYEHAVLPGRGGRVSLVLKRALDRGGGRKGHGLAGQGRRSRRRRLQNELASSNKRPSNRNQGIERRSRRK